MRDFAKNKESDICISAASSFVGSAPKFNLKYIRILYLVRMNDTIRYGIMGPFGKAVLPDSPAVLLIHW
jgi:hypothetical protein